MIKKYDLVSGMFTSETKIRMRYSETDQMGFVYHVNFFAYFKSARVESLPVRQAGIRQLGLTYADMEKIWCDDAGSGGTCKIFTAGPVR